MYINPLIWLVALPVVAGIIATVIILNDQRQERLRRDSAAIKFALAHFDALKQPDTDVITLASLRAASLIDSGNATLKYLIFNIERFGHIIDSKGYTHYEATPGGVAVIPLYEHTYAISRDDLNRF